MLSSTFDSTKNLLAGGVNGATNNPWYFLVLHPKALWLQYPPIPFVIIQSLIVFCFFHLYHYISSNVYPYLFIFSFAVLCFLPFPLSLSHFLLLILFCHYISQEFASCSFIFVTFYFSSFWFYFFICIFYLWI